MPRGPISRVVMDFLVYELKQIEATTTELNRISPVQFEKLIINLREKYVDDVLYGGQALKTGIKWDSATKSLTWGPEQDKIDREANTPQDQRTMKIVAQISSQVLECLNFTWDSPTLNASNKMPVLDTQMWVAQESREKKIPDELCENEKVLKHRELQRIIYYQFYKKPRANPCPNLQRSGIPVGNKRATATQEIIRRLKNTSREAPTDIVKEILIDYMGELAQGGYSVKWRIEVLAAALTNYIKLWNNEVEGKGQINHPDHITKMKRRAAKLVGNLSWFKRLPNKENNQIQTKN